MPELIHAVRPPTTQYPSASTDASIAEFALPAEEFALADLFEHVPDVRVKLDPTVANPNEHALLVIQTDEQGHAIDAVLRTDPDVAAVERFGERADGWTYRVTWEGCPRRLIQRLIAADATLLSAQGRNGQWQLRLLTPDRDGIAQAHEIMDDLDCAADCQRISTFDSRGSNRSELTNEQHEALIVAFERGYYDIPRDITADELADQLGISHQALSERFRRAYEMLIDDNLVVDNDREN